MDKQEASNLISEKMSQARNLIYEAVHISEMSGIVFHLSWGGEGLWSSALGGTYVPTTASKDDKDWYRPVNKY